MRLSHDGAPGVRILPRSAAARGRRLGRVEPLGHESSRAVRASEDVEGRASLARRVRRAQSVIALDARSLELASALRLGIDQYSEPGQYGVKNPWHIARSRSTMVVMLVRLPTSGTRDHSSSEISSGTCGKSEPTRSTTLAGIWVLVHRLWPTAPQRRKQADKYRR